MTVADDQPGEATDATETADEQPEEATNTTDTADEQPEEATDTTETPEERLDALGAEIHNVRQKVDLDDPIEDGDRQFIDKGEEEPVDDTVAPPG